jgi:filamentous hemagglutinin family protein
VTTNNQRDFTVEVGNPAGGNLFHSFQSFTVPTGSSVFFNNATTVQNIFSRVTGSNISAVDGLIRANGNANLFLLNPNGIIFGANAVLNIGGSFIGSTASSIRFADGNTFSATANEASPLLTISAPIGLQLGANPGNIQVQGSGNNLSSDSASFAIDRNARPIGLQVATGQTLALVGGNVALDGGNLTAEAGRIELGAGQSGLVRLAPVGNGWQLGYGEVQNFQNIRMTRAASIDVSGRPNGLPNGTVQIQGGNIAIQDGSVVLGINEGREVGGSLRLEATQQIEISGVSANRNSNFSSGIYAEAGRSATGRGGNILLSAPRVRFFDRGYSSVTTVGAGDAGNLNIQAGEVEVTGRSQRRSSSLLAATGPTATGKGGDLNINATRLRITDGAQIGASTFGRGAAGSINLQADEVAVIGAGERVASLISTGANRRSTGAGGNLNIAAQKLSILDGGNIIADTFSSGRGGNLIVTANEVLIQGVSEEARSSSRLSTDVSRDGTGSGGNLTLTTNRLQIAEGGAVSVETRGGGNSGELIIRAQTIEVIGQSNPNRPQSAISALSLSRGNAGSLNLITDQLILRNAGEINVSSQGRGAAGDVDITAKQISLNNSAKILARTGAGDRGNIQLNSGTVVLQRASTIATSATGSATGGNIIINADAIVLTDRSDVVARAVLGQGGNINITTQGLFQTTNTRIDASSELGIDGTVQVNSPDTDPRRQVSELPNQVIDTSQLIANSCLVPSSQRRGTFIITGAGGLPASPNLPGRSPFPTYDIPMQRGSQATIDPSIDPPPPIEATGLYRLENGKTVFGRLCS